MAGASFPQTLTEAVVYYNDPETAHAEMVKFRWPDGVVRCPTCGSDKVYAIASRKVWQCKENHAKRQFSLKVGSIMEDSALSISKWLIASWLITNAKNGISSYELHRAIGISQKSAWHMLHRIRLAMQSEDGGKLAGEVECDETLIGGKSRNMHAAKRKALIAAFPAKREYLHGQPVMPRQSKVAVLGMLQRGSDGASKVRTVTVSTVKRHELQRHVRENVEQGSSLYTDSLRSYRNMDNYEHEFIDHANEYVRGNVHTNGLENFWSLLKRTLGGTYISVEPFHLFRYLDEQAFRFNNRKLSDAARFAITAASVFGKRLTWDNLTASNASL